MNTNSSDPSEVNTRSTYYIGMMSGTSLDGVDIVLASIPSSGQFSLINAQTYPIPESLKKNLLSLSQDRKLNELDEYAVLDVQMGHLFAQHCLQFLKESNIKPEQIRAIGNHGQTLRHYPNTLHPTTLQIGDPNIIAQSTGITTIADFRRRDMAAGGQGAPLVPPFHQAIFSHQKNNRIVLNIGGIANITWLAAQSKAVTGYDTGPGNGLMDDWCLRHFNCDYDENGQLAGSGKVNSELLSAMLADPYFSQKTPKSTGREYFSYDWITEHLGAGFKNINARDVLATLMELTCHSVIDEFKRLSLPVNELLVCGGGAKNSLLMKRLSELAGEGVSVSSTESHGLHPDWVEASAFAWLAHRTLNGLTGNLPSVTGAAQKVILGAIWPA